MANIIQIIILVIAIIIQVPISNKDIKPPSIDARNPVVLYKNTNKSIIAINPNGINLNINFVNFTHKQIWKAATNKNGII